MINRQLDDLYNDRIEFDVCTLAPKFGKNVSIPKARIIQVENHGSPTEIALGELTYVKDDEKYAIPIAMKIFPDIKGDEDYGGDLKKK